MSNRERHPISISEKQLLDDSFDYELAQAENNPHRLVALEVIARNLNIANYQALYDGLDVVASGYVIKTFDSSTTGVLTQICGKLMAFGTVFVKKVPYLSATVASQAESGSIVLSAEPRLGWSLSPLIPYETSLNSVNAWDRVANSSFDAQDLLARASLRYAHPLFGATHDSLLSLESVLASRFNLRTGDNVSVEGTQALVAKNGKTISDNSPLPLNEAVLLGRYEGLVSHEHKSKEECLARLCMALTLDNGDIALQPCGSMRLVEVPHRD